MKEVIRWLSERAEAVHIYVDGPGLYTVEVDLRDGSCVGVNASTLERALQWAYEEGVRYEDMCAMRSAYRSRKGERE